jgi:hypothetical protein
VDAIRDIFRDTPTPSERRSLAPLQLALRAADQRGARRFACRGDTIWLDTYMNCFVESRIEAQRRLYRLRPEPLMELDAWLVPFRSFWLMHVDALERHLDKRSAKGKKKK